MLTNANYVGFCIWGNERFSSDRCTSPVHNLTNEEWAVQRAYMSLSVKSAQPHLDHVELVVLKGKQAMIGVLGLSDPSVEEPVTVAAGIRRLMSQVPIQKISVAPDCGLKYLRRDVAFRKMKATVGGATIVRSELAC